MRMNNKFLNFEGYFNEEDAIDIIVFFNTGDQAMITDIKPSVSTDDQYLSVEKNGSYAAAFYFDVERVRYFSICPRKNGNAWKFKDTVSMEDVVDETFNLE